MIFVAATAFSQNAPAKPLKMLLLEKPNKLPGSSVLRVETKNHAAEVKQIISPDYYVSQLGFFCKQEIKLEKVTKIPFRFRLGSIEECDKMEGKRRNNAPVL